MPDFLSVHITTATREEAQKIADALVEERLVACVNIVADVFSIYRWQGKVVREPECLLLAKTTGKKFDALIKRVKELHSYECPCIIATPIVEGSKDFLSWLEEETSPSH